MAEDRMPITPSVLTWARERAGYELEDLATMPKFLEIADWEIGERRPTYRQLEALSDCLKVSLAIFFFPAPPEGMRHWSANALRMADANVRQSLRMQYLVDITQLRQREYARLSAWQESPDRLIVHDLSMSPGDDLAVKAAKVRDYLGITVALQRDWSENRTQFEVWRRRFFNAGVYVMLEDFRQDDCASLALFDSRFPVIAVSKSAYDSGGGLIATCRSLARLLLHSSGFEMRGDTVLSKLDADSQQTAMLHANLAAEIVAPTAALEKEISLSIGETGAVPPIRKIAQQFGVAEGWLRKRLLELNLFNEKYAEDSAWVAATPNTGAIENVEMNALMRFGDSFVRMAFDCFDSDYMNELELAECLELAPASLDGLRYRLESREMPSCEVG